jgi:tetratricopeptide (TPR) repeat protein
MVSDRQWTRRLGIGLALWAVTFPGWPWGVLNDVRAAQSAGQPSAEFSGSASCRACHESFYSLWAGSHHGLAMQPYSAAFARANLTPQAEEVRIGNRRYRAGIDANEGFVQEWTPEGPKQYRLLHVLGGKNVYYFLTPMERGRLQTLPLAYDVHKKEWFDTAASGVRHFPGARPDAPVPWTDSLYTFNTSCYGCHVSQLATNYDLKTDTYHTRWVEPGINCETCHGPGQEHVQACRAAPPGPAPRDLKIISTRAFTAEQTNSMCASCHAKMNAVSPSFTAGQRYFDHFDLILLEDPDFYPDGRDLGENYTMTTWRMSPCVKSGKLGCTHCHTSSGRYRFRAAENPNAACLPCHRQRVENAAEHTHHEADGAGGKCVSCHMPTTAFARMSRSDHSMRPPTPAATLAFQSPNACNLCHADRDAQWADKQVRQWYTKDYQKPVLQPAQMVDDARKRRWNHLDQMLTYIARPDRDEVFAGSLLRLLAGCESAQKWPVIVRVLRTDPSPLVRACAVQTLNGCPRDEALKAILEATRDDYRLVRVRAAAGLAGVRPEMLAAPYDKSLAQATAEFIEAMKAHGDDYTSHYNLGNFYLEGRQYGPALASYQTATRLRPDFVPTYVNAAFACNALGQNDQAQAYLQKAVELDRKNVPAWLNLGMLLGEQGQSDDAAQAFRQALQLDPNSAVAAYNLGVLLAAHRVEEGLPWCRKAYNLRPDIPKYGFTYAFYLNQTGAQKDAIGILTALVGRKTADANTYRLLGAIYERRGQFDRAAGVYQAGADNEALAPADRESLAALAKGRR